MRAFALLLMRSLWIAGGLAGLFGTLGIGFPPLAIVGGAVVALVALRKGWVSGGFVGLIAVVPITLAWLGWSSRPGLLFPLTLALIPPLLVAAEVLRRTESQGAALLFFGLVVAGFDLLMHVVVGDVAAFWNDWLRRAIATVPGASFPGLETEPALRLMNGFLGFLFGLALMLAMLFARWLQALAYNPGGFGPEFRRLRLPRMVLPATVAAIWGVGSIDPLLGAEWLMAAMLVYFFVGLATIHGVVAVRGMATSWLIPAYLVLFFLPQVGIPGLALLGALDAFVDFRAQRPAGTPGNRS